MKLSRPIWITSLGMFCWVASGQQPSPQIKNDTQGACSQIITDNKGTINISCPGFSREQMRQMILILNRIDKDRLNPRIVLEKLDEISDQMKQVTKVTQGLAPRVLTEESKSLLAAWAKELAGKEGVSVQTQEGDPEAKHLALEIQTQIKLVDVAHFVGQIDVIGGDQTGLINVSISGPKERKSNVDALCTAIRKSNIVVNENLVTVPNPKNEPISIIVYSKP
jgi:hypothetical protein